MEKNMIRIPEF